MQVLRLQLVRLQLVVLAVLLLRLKIRCLSRCSQECLILLLVSETLVLRVVCLDLGTVVLIVQLW